MDSLAQHVGTLRSAHRARIGVAGAPSVDRDIIVACLAARYDAFVLNMGSLVNADCQAVVLLDPRPRDWRAAASRGLPVLLIVGEGDTLRQDVVYALRGADALVSFNSSVEHLLEVVETVLEGGTIFDPMTVRKLATALRSQRVGPLDLDFTDREQSVLEALQKGQSVKETARSLGVSTRTVQAAQARLFAKLGARNRAHAISLVHRRYGGVRETDATAS